jgi:hypothetical protein
MRKLPLTMMILIVFPVVFTYLELYGEFRSGGSFSSLEQWLPLLLASLATVTILSFLWLARKWT